MQNLICYANNASLEIRQIWIDLFQNLSHLREIMYYEGILLKNQKNRSPYHSPLSNEVDHPSSTFQIRKFEIPFKPCFDH